MKKREIKDKSVTFVIPIICVVVLNLIFSLINHGGICVTLKNMIAEILFIYAIFVVLMILSKSSFISNVVTIIGYSGLFLVNQLKIYTAGEPLYISDFHLASDVADISKLVDYNDYRIIIFLCGISFFVLAMLTVSYITRIKLKTRKNQFFIIMSIISITILTLVISPSQSLRGFYKSFLYEINTRNLNGAPLNNIQYYIKYGMLSGMYGNWLENIIEEPESYNRDELESILSKYENYQVSKDEELPKSNIIILFSESFMDVEKIPDIEFNKDVTPNLDKLKEKGLYVNMISPSYGGMSMNVDFEILTGCSNRYFNNGYIPMIQWYSGKKAETHPSLVKELKNNDYITKIIFGNDYYDSKEHCYKIGFDEYIDLGNKPQIKGYHLSDEYMIDYAINELENKPEDKKIFLLLETIQNHLPFEEDKYEEYDIEITKSTLSEKEEGDYLSYAQGVYDADKQLNRLYEYIQTYNEPTILIFLGDHLPYIYSVNLMLQRVDVTESMEYFNTGDELLDTYRKYNTEALILSNYDMNICGREDTLGPNFLLNYVVNRMNLKLSPFYKLLYTTKDILPAGNRLVTIDKYKKLYNNIDIDGEMKEVYDLLEKMQYMLWLDK